MSSTPKQQAPAKRDALPDDGLIKVAEFNELGAGHGVLRAGVLTLVLVAILGTTLVDTLFPLPLPELTGRERVAAEERRNSAKLADGSLAREIEHELQLTSHVRSEVSRQYSLQLYHWLHEAHGNSAIVGSGGWVFVKNRVLAQNAGTKSILRNWASTLTALRRSLAGHGVRIRFMPIPRRGVVQAQFLPANIDPRADIDMSAARTLTEFGIEAVDLYPTYMNWDGPPLFYRADAHWNEVGERLAAEDSLRQFGMLAPPGQRIGQVKQAGVEKQGTQEDQNRDLYRLVGILPPGDSDMLRGEDLPVYNVFPLKRKMPLDKPGAIALTGTSFSARRKFSKFLDHYGGFNIFDGSMSAAGPVEPIRRLLEKHGDSLPEVILAEFPIYSAFEGSYLLEKEIARLITENPPVGAQPFGKVKLRPIQAAVPIGAEAVVQRPNSAILETANGSLLSTWDNLIGLRIRGEVLSGAVEFTALRRGVSHPLRWDVGTHESFLPLIDPRLEGRGFRLNVNPRKKDSKVRIDEVEFVTTAKIDEQTPLVPLGSGMLPKRWHVDFKLPAAEKPGQDRVLIIGPWASESWSTDTLVVQALSSKTKKVHRRLALGSIAPGGWVFVSLGSVGATEDAIIRFAGSKKQSAPKIEPFVANVRSALSD